jgi:very-short-patch-repair endonuclease
MGRTSFVPSQLLNGPFTLEEARRAGISRSALRSKSWRRLANGLYCARDGQDDPLEILRGWVRALPDGTIFAGATAAWLHGLDLDPLNPIEVIVGPDKGVRSRAGLTARRCVVAGDDVLIRRGVCATGVHRMLVDVCCWRSPVEALVILDMAVAAGLAGRVAVAEHANSIRGRAGSARLRELIALAEPAESPMETRLRWFLLKAGLPRPEVQVNLYDAAGGLIARADMYYPTARLVIEFDGMNHIRRLIADDRRQNLLTAAGYQLLRYTTADLKERPDLILAQVRAALASPANRAL